MSSQNYSISKSSFLKFEQCPKAFFLYKNHPYLRDKIGIDKQLTFNRGHKIGELAQQLFEGGVDASKQTKNAAEAAVLTAELISKKTKTIYEATFIFDKVLIMVDILHFENNAWNAYEVKSSLKVSETYLLDACLQYYVLKNSLDLLEDFFLVTLNGDYVRGEELEPKKLFKKRSIKKEGEKNFEYFTEKLKAAHLTLEQNTIPDIPIGKHCFRPYTCDFFGICWKGLNSEGSIFELPLTSKDVLFEWYNSGKRDIVQLAGTEIENKQVAKVRDSSISGKPIVNKTVIGEFVSQVQYPFAAFDMEIWSPAIPTVAGTKPFQQIPFLFCIYDGSAQTYFLTEHTTDDRKQFALELVEQTKNYSSLLVYDKTMEVQAINGLIQQFPALEAELNAVKLKMCDLSDIFKNLDYYESSFKNNFSLKTISEALKLDVSFDTIRSGLEAMNYYERMREEANEMERKILLDALVAYCFNDTRAAYRLFGFLKETAS